MPPAMTSLRGGPTRSSSTSSSMSGSVPRREPLRRLYPLQRGRTASDSVREVSNFGDENMPTSGISINMVENPKDLGNQSTGSSAKRRAQKLVFIASGTAGAGGNQRNTPVARTQSVPVQRYGASERSGSAERVPTYSRPSLIRRSSDVGSVSSYGPSCPVHSDSSSAGRRSGSILKRPSSSRSSTSSSMGGSHRGRGEVNSVSMNHKQVQFCPNVSVVHMDEDGEHLSTHVQELNGEKRKRMGTLSRGQLSRNYDNVIYITDDTLGLQDSNSKVTHDQRRSSNEHQSQPQSHLARDGRFRDLFKRLNSSSGTLRSITDQGEESGPLKKGQFDITFSNRPGELTKLRFVLHMGQDYNPNDLVVKANTTGSRIRVLATRTDRNSRQTEEFNEKYMLPMDIDPYAIEARLDKWGNLTVEAPLLTLEKRPELNKPNNVLCAIYV